MHNCFISHYARWLPLTKRIQQRKLQTQLRASTSPPPLPVTVTLDLPEETVQSPASSVDKDLENRIQQTLASCKPAARSSESSLDEDEVEVTAVQSRKPAARSPESRSDEDEVEFVSPQATAARNFATLNEDDDDDSVLSLVRQEEPITPGRPKRSRDLANEYSSSEDVDLDDNIMEVDNDGSDQTDEEAAPDEHSLPNLRCMKAIRKYYRKCLHYQPCAIHQTSGNMLGVAKVVEQGRFAESHFLQTATRK